MKLYNVVGSGNCRKVLATINHLGLDVDIEHLDFFAGDLSTPDFLRVNPNGRVPALTDGDFCLWESNAIMQYLADQVSDSDLFPRDPKARADISRWQCWELAHFNNALATVAFETIVKAEFMGQAANQPLVENALSNLAEFAAILEGHLANRDFVVGNGITLADYSIINIEGFKESIPFDWSPYTRVNAYFERMRAVPHWAQTAAPSQEAIGRKPVMA